MGEQLQSPTVSSPVSATQATSKSMETVGNVHQLRVINLPANHAFVWVVTSESTESVKLIEPPSHPLLTRTLTLTHPPLSSRTLYLSTEDSAAYRLPITYLEYAGLAPTTKIYAQTLALVRVGLRKLGHTAQKSEISKNMFPVELFVRMAMLTSRELATSVEMFTILIRRHVSVPMAM